MEQYVIRITADESVQERESQTHKMPVAIPTNPAFPTANQSLVKSGASKLLSGTSIPSSSLIATGSLFAAGVAFIQPIASNAVDLMALQTGNHKLQQKMHTVQNMASLLTPQGLGQAAVTAIRHDIEYNNECQRLGVLRERAGIATSRRR